MQVRHRLSKSSGLAAEPLSNAKSTGIACTGSSSMAAYKSIGVSAEALGNSKVLPLVGILLTRSKGASKID